MKIIECATPTEATRRARAHAADLRATGEYKKVATHEGLREGRTVWAVRRRGWAIVAAYRVA